MLDSGVTGTQLGIQAQLKNDSNAYFMPILIWVQQLNKALFTDTAFGKQRGCFAGQVKTAGISQ